MQKMNYDDVYPDNFLLSIGDENTELEIQAVASDGSVPFVFLHDEDEEYFKQHSVADALARKNPKLLPKRLRILDYQSYPPQMTLFVEFEGEDTDVISDYYNFGTESEDETVIVDVIAWQKGTRLIAHGKWRIYLYPERQLIKVSIFYHNAYKPPEEWKESGTTIQYRVSVPSEGEDAISDDDPDWGEDDD